MKHLLLKCLLLAMALLYCTPKVAAQEISELKVSAAYRGKSLKLILLDYEITYRLKFEYDEAQIAPYTVVANFKRKSLEEGLSILLDGTGLGFNFLSERRIAIVPQAEVKVESGNSSYTPTAFNFPISGRVKDKKTGETLPFASIQVKGTIKGTSTNVDGYFTILDVPSDTALLQVEYIGYQGKQFRLTPEMDMKNLVVYLEDFSQSLQEVLVTAQKEEQLIKASTGISRISISPAVLSKLPSFGEKDVFRSLQLLPGISGSNESSSGLFVRGGTPDQNLILFDGFTVYHVDHLFGFFSAFNPNAIKDVQLYKGGFEAKYGGRLSSVVELTGKDGNTEEFNAGVGLSLVSMNAFVEGPFAKGKGSFLAAARRSFQSGFYNNLFNSFTGSNQAEVPNNLPPQLAERFGQQQTQPNSYFYDLNAKLTYRPSAKDVLALSFYNGQDDLDNSRDTDNSAFQGRGGRLGGTNPQLSFQRNTTDLTNWGNWGASAKWARQWNERFYSNANFSYSNYYSERDRRTSVDIMRADTSFTRSGGTYEFNDLKDLSFKLDNELKLSEQNQLDFGLQATYNDIEYAFTQNDTISVLDRDDTGTTTAFYIQDRHTFGEKLILKGGLRAAHYSITNKVYFEPRASFTYLLNDRIKLKGAWGQYNQFATRIVREDIQQGSRDFWLLANDENVPISYAEHYIAGISYETPKWLFDVETYHKNLDGLSEYSTRFTPSGSGRNRTLDYEEFFYQGTGVARGIEFLLQRKVGKLTGWIGYTLGEVLYDFEAFGTEPFFANQDQTHEAKFVGTYQLGDITFGASFIYATGSPYTAPTGFYEIPLLDGTTADYFEVSAKNGLRLPDYHRLDLSATWDFRMGETKASLGLSVFNVYNRQNVWYKEYDVIEGELLETNISLLNATPSLFFNWTLR